MPGTRAHISRDRVKTLQRGDWINDDIVPGFKARRPNKHVLYGVNMRIAGRMRWVTIGSELEWTPDQARAEAERIRGLKRQGLDVAADRDRRRATPLLSFAAERFLKEHAALKLKRRTAAHYEEMLHRLVLPGLGHYRMDTLTTADIARWHASLAGTPTQANRALAILSSLMRWAKDLHLTADQPCTGVQRYRELPVNRYPTAADLSAILRAAEVLASEGEVNPFFAVAIKIMIVSGARRSEVFDARWEWLDVERRALVLPDSKTGAKVVALPGAALTAILELPRFAENPHIFPSERDGRPFVNFGPNWRKVLERASVGRWRLHDLRHGFAAIAVEGGIPLHVLGRQLGHRRPITTNRYAHVGDEPRRAAAELVADIVTNRGTVDATRQ